MAETTKLDKIRQLSQEQLNAIEHLLQGKSDRATAEAIGVSRQTVWEWRNKNPVFMASLNKRRNELWNEARERLWPLTNRALDVLELQLGSDDPRTSMAAAKYILKGSRLINDTDLPIGGPTTPEDVILGELRRKARAELEVKIDPKFPLANLFEIEEEASALAQRRLKKALADAGLS